MPKESNKKPQDKAYFIAEGEKKNLIDNLDLAVLVCGLATSSESLADFHSFRADPFFRFYYVVSGSTKLVFPDETCTLTGGNMYLIPSSRPFRYERPKDFEHYWVHFCSDFLGKLPHFQQVIALAATSTIQRDMKDFISHAKDSEEIRAIMGANIVLRKILTPFLETIPDGNYERLKIHQEFTSVIEYINEHITEPLAIPELAKLACMNRNDFSAKFSKAFGLPPKRYICNSRIYLARNLLLTTELSIKEIGRKTGYDNEFFFYRIFKKYTGMSPSVFRKNFKLGY